MVPVHEVTAADATLVALLVAAAVCLVLLGAILVGPFRSVRDEPPIDPAAENRLLLGTDPEQPTGEMPRISLAEAPESTPDDASLSELRELDDEPHDDTSV